MFNNMAEFFFKGIMSDAESQIQYDLTHMWNKEIGSVKVETEWSVSREGEAEKMLVKGYKVSVRNKFYINLA